MVKLPHGLIVVSRLIPAGERDAILGDLIEDATSRGLSGARLSGWLWIECVSVAVAIAFDRLRDSLIPPMREVAAGVALDGTRTLRHARGGPIGVLLSILLICASAVVIALSAEVLIGTLLAASYR